MQGIPDSLFPDGYPLSVQQETDTATLRPSIPIYPVHLYGRAFCEKPLCACHCYETAVRRLLGAINEGALTLETAGPLLTPGRKGATSGAAGSAQTAAIVIYVDLLPGIPETCQLYGHSWTHSGDRDVKACALCGIRGYCPACTPDAPAGAQPFTCTFHASREVRQ